MLGLRCCVQAFSSCRAGAALQVWFMGFSCGAQALGTRAKQLWYMGLVAPQRVPSSWTPGINSVSPALAGRLLATGPAGKTSSYQNTGQIGSGSTLRASVNFLLSLSVVSDSLRSHGLLCSWHSPAKNTGVGCHALLQGIFLTQESNSRVSCLLHWQVGSLPLVPPEKPLSKY